MLSKDKVLTELANCEWFVQQAKGAVWNAYDLLKYGVGQDKTKSWLYDVACILEIIENDEKLLWLLSYYYGNSSELPWNKLKKDGKAWQNV